MLDIVCFVLGKWLLDRKSKESEMYDEHKHVLKTATSGNALNPHSPFFGLEFHVNTTYAYRWKVAPYVATFRVLGKKKSYIFLHIQENICISYWVPIFYNSELNLITGIQARSLDVLIDFQWTVLPLLCKME